MKIVGFLLGISVAMNMAMAQAAGAADNVANAANAANEMERLFFSKEKRALLDRQRSQNVHEERTLQGAIMSLDGVVQRAGGKATVWINGRAQQENDGSRTGLGVAVQAGVPGRALLSPADDLPTKLQVGEAINRATGERNTRLGAGRVAVHTANKNR
ncbi:MAG TPA: hypothetical protein VJ001_12460 [Rhodocyclaceae bacterium]|nr:hypothetical protein [Rhodocyclaceae bacterium]